MKYEISPDNKTLTLTCSPEEREEIRTRHAELKEKGWEFTSADECEFLESLICNSELDWADPANTGDLTDAPMLEILGEVTPESKKAVFPDPVFGWVHCGRWDGENQFHPILQRWAFMDYQVRSFLTDLMETGKAVFTS